MVTTKPEFDFVFRIKKERYLVMSYLNNQLGYRDALLDTRSIIKKGDYIVLDPDGLVKNVVPGYENCDVTILGSPAMGATFADYLVHVHEGGKNTGIGGEGIESRMMISPQNLQKVDTFTHQQVTTLLLKLKARLHYMYTDAVMSQLQDTVLTQ